MSRLHKRLPRLLSLWAWTAAAEGALYYFFLSQPFMREVFAPFAIAVLGAALAGTWRVLRRRGRADRRARERRAGKRRVGE